MEGFNASGFSADNHAVKKKRSCIARRPRPDSQTLINTSTFLPQSTQILGGNNEGSFKDTMTGIDGSGGENKLKLKLKFGGVTRTIQAASSTEHSFGGTPSVVKSSHHFDSPPPRQNQVIQCL